MVASLATLCLHSGFGKIEQTPRGAGRSSQSGVLASDQLSGIRAVGGTRFASLQSLYSAGNAARYRAE